MDENTLQFLGLLINAVLVPLVLRINARLDQFERRISHIEGRLHLQERASHE